MSFDDLSEYEVQCIRENAIMRRAQLWLLEVSGVITMNGTANPFEDVMLLYKDGRKIYKDWVFRHDGKATIYLQRESGKRSIQDIYRSWERSAESMGKLISDMKMSITRID